MRACLIFLSISAVNFDSLGIVNRRYKADTVGRYPNRRVYVDGSNDALREECLGNSSNDDDGQLNVICKSGLCLRTTVFLKQRRAYASVKSSS